MNRVEAMNREALKHLLDAPPMLHSAQDFRASDSGTLASWGIQPSFLEYLVEVVSEDSLTLETGSGVSTVCFAIIGSNHTCVSPAAQEHARIQAYCREHGISIERIRFIPMKSEDYLPSLDLGALRLDFGLIDGSHAFPNPIIDYHYINRNLKVGGLLAIDDLAIPSVGILHKFMLTEPAYEFVRFDGAKTGIYRKVAETLYPNDWPDQNFNRAWPDLSYLPVALRLRVRLGSVSAIRRVYRSLRRWLGYSPFVR